MSHYPPTNPSEFETDDESLFIRPEIPPDMLIAVTLLKQYAYCPRIVYYETCTPRVRPTSSKMQAGHDAHERERNRAARRTMSAYQIPTGERHFDVRIRSEKMGLSGLIDELVITEDEAIVVDYKMSSRVGANHLLQLAAYSILVEEAYQVAVRRGFIYLMTARRFEEVPVEVGLRNSVAAAIAETERIRIYEYMPPPVEQLSKCESCEFRRFCNDI